MTDDLDLTKLSQTLKAATPRPEPEQRKAHIAQAMAAFDAHQGSASGPRHTPATGPYALVTGVKTMLTRLTSPAALTATTAIAACGFLFLTPVGQEVLRPLALDRPAAPAEPAPATFDGIFVDNSANVEAAESLAESEPVFELAPQIIEAAPPVIRREVGAIATEDRARLAPSPAPADAPLAGLPEANSEEFANADPNPLRITAEHPVSTFSIDVDTASYAYVRSALSMGQLPDPAAVRVEEMVNYFPYDYPAPGSGDAPFATDIAVVETPWNSGTRLVRIGLQGRLPVVEDRPPLNLVFLIDTSGSMADQNKLPLLRQALSLLLPHLTAADEVAIVTYAGTSATALAPVPATDRAAIEAALSGLTSGGSTNGAGGLEEAYRLAATMTEEGEVSRILLATDGDFNVGLSDPGGLETYIARQRESGTYLSVLGFGRGNLDDATMQALAQAGNGIAAYIDTLSEAQKVLVDQLSGALFPIADDVKVQVEWNPATVAEYRLIGFETRALAREDFNNDRVDAGELGAGHAMTALYEITPS